MHHRSFWPVLMCSLTLLLAGAPAGAQVPDEEARITPEMRRALRAARTIRVEVKQDYDIKEEKPEEMDEEDKEEKDEAAKDGDAQPEKTKTAKEEPEEAKPEEAYTLPLAELAEGVVRLTGWKLVKPGAAADVVMTIEAHGTPVGANYIGSLAGYHYTGAKLDGTVRLMVGEQVATEAEIFAEIPIEQTIRSYSYNYRSSPRDAPFRETLPHFCETLFVVISRAWGPEPVAAGLKLEDADQQTGAARALLEVGDASIAPTLIALLGKDNDTLARVAALGLGVHGGASALPPLLAALRLDKSETALAGYKDPSDHELVRSLTEAEESVLPPAERATAARDLLEERGGLHRAVEWALLQVEAPDKFSQLTAALTNPDSVMLRRGAAVVLGGLEDKRAFESLAAAARDKDPLVRAAALAALIRLKDERSTEIFLAAAGDATGYVAKIARDPLVETAGKRLVKFIESREKSLDARGWIPLPALLECFTHPDPLVRAAAARISSQRHEPELMAGLTVLLQSDPQAFVREAVAGALAESPAGPRDGILALALDDADAATRRHAVDALRETYAGEDEPGSKSKPIPLPEAALEPVLASVARDEMDPAAAASLLERIEGPGVADTLLRALQDNRRPPAVKNLAGRRLAGLGDKRAGPPLLALLAKAGEDEATHDLLDALVKLGDPALLEPLFAQLKSGTTSARRRAMVVLGRLREPRAIGPLIAALRAGESARLGDPAEGTAGAAREALETLTGKNFANGDEWLRWWKENAGKPIVLPPPKAPEGETPAGEPVVTPGKD